MLKKASLVFMFFIFTSCTPKPTLLEISPTPTLVPKATATAKPLVDIGESTEEEIWPTCYIAEGGEYNPTVHLKWNKQSDQLAFTNSSYELYLANFGQNKKFSLEKLAEDVHRFTWFADKQLILFSTYSSSSKELMQIDLNTKEITSILRNSTTFDALKLSPDLDKVSFLFKSQLAIAPIAKLTEKEVIIDSLEGKIVDSYSWGPQGMIVYEYLLNPNPQTNSQIAIVDIETKESQIISDETICARMPTWSPDGQYISFYSNQNETWDIFMYEVDTGQVRAITQNLDIEQGFSWMNTNQFAFLSRSFSDYGTKTEETIYVVNIEGNKQWEFKIPEGGCCLDNFAISPNGQYMAFLYRKEDLWHISLIEMTDSKTVADIFSFPVFRP